MPKEQKGTSIEVPFFVCMLCELAVIGARCRKKTNNEKFFKKYAKKGLTNEGQSGNITKLSRDGKHEIEKFRKT
ncbi:MAG: hypothetical protein IJD81_06590 [Oscillospiraceae bacterium]|nr:hypothetical protein [Oscillospiraceae bacterium]